MTKYEKIAATRAANREKRKSQTITVDKDWTIVRADPLNWEVRYKGKFDGYFPTVCGALKSIPDRMVNLEAKGSLKEVVSIHRAIQDRIENAFSGKL